jgi:hypothetical protein
MSLLVARAYRHPAEEPAGETVLHVALHCPSR